MKNKIPTLFIAAFTLLWGGTAYSQCILVCPADITVSNDVGDCGALVPYPTPSATSCGTISVAPASGSFYPVGQTTVLASEAGTSITCNFRINVDDTEPPVATCPADISQTVDGATDVDFSFDFSDNCPDVTGLCSPQSGSEFPLGLSAVECSATDTSGNESVCDFSVDLTETAPTGSDLSITKEASDSAPDSGDDIVYRVEVVNAGPEANSNVVLRDTLPNKVLFLAFVASAGDCVKSGVNIECRLPLLAAGESFTVELTAKTLDSGTVSNTATVSGDKTDPNLDNNSATSVINVGSPSGGGGCSLLSTATGSLDLSFIWLGLALVFRRAWKGFDL